MIWSEIFKDLREGQFGVIFDRFQSVEYLLEGYFYGGWTGGPLAGPVSPSQKKGKP